MASDCESETMRVRFPSVTPNIMKELAIHTKTQKQCDELLMLLEEEGWVWRSGRAPTSFPECWNGRKECTCIYLEEGKRLAVGHVGNVSKESATLITFDVYMNKFNPRKQPNLNHRLIKAIRGVL